MIDVTPFSAEYAGEVIDVILPIQTTEFSIPITLQDQPDLQDIPHFYQHGNGNFWIARDADKVVGTIALLDIGNGEVALRKMFVSVAYRGRTHGVASALLHALMMWCQQKRIRAVFLGTTEKFLAAHRFYEKNGFREIPKESLPMKFPVMKVDTKFYAYSVPPRAAAEFVSGGIA